jgi:hypothetical protein
VTVLAPACTRAHHASCSRTRAPKHAHACVRKAQGYLPFYPFRAVSAALASAPLRREPMRRHRGRLFALGVQAPGHRRVRKPDHAVTREELRRSLPPQPRRRAPIFPSWRAAHPRTCPLPFLLSLYPHTLRVSEPPAASTRCRTGQGLGLTTMVTIFRALPLEP